MSTPSDKLSSYFKADDTIYAGKGCSVCAGSGYHGRVALFEIIEITPEMQELILNSPGTIEIEKLARKQGSEPMFYDGIEKVKLGATSLTEVVRVVAPSTKD